MVGNERVKINLIAIGKKMPDWIQTGVTHYQKQLPRELNFTLTTPEAQKRKGKNIEQIKELEGELLIKASASANLIVAFDEHGKQHSTKEIAKAMKDWQQNGDSVALLIGGADGLSNTIKQQAHQLWGLSNLTLPHSMARLLAVEQIYRAHSLLTNHPYHRE
ncbi:23S rRNA (pseudouridine(1915)-N(3))-methyltransferase (EC 2.1.1.177) [uncultured Gammaproteobacteria bacterium]|jgi:23S rRNA (pseudouridine1915-N3)-methyltransferase|uniref:23S rRNA (pseudouridine(1915)-N(3))-methyltransferase RlmH n=1 Tax=thiotrophic endosymbiont of Bathymodiolus puteoserpentis (Logatchev) TaxID=343240 RepID=UPI001A3495C4|nr:23S rRNA (pseudouridine(1915)-N(3))-methyltransferase RlmH [thiotrophic endosymbiont of Bathymodiolus puteoserpentis (Logatchev)]CAC9585660.1 23S rRNA (pseudouridine(1915)-N(3))-methyltransferase (EC 2.1.1.177) [uncultured Gammaproteobacteria bacterium]CAC9638821.1 23S rRNA (pseudouridine(1915)-N(3))-methyltransferase (EC 2.1.1.177) [uncultured Gammaproteobacteria bacterium]CAC9987517.1 23S rRNA (pseudouridine(1915)-N(3))-methyltransferase (EC 2.1.1.177) [uncultured Gammaproteobacteria bacter